MEAKRIKVEPFDTPGCTLYLIDQYKNYNVEKLQMETFDLVYLCNHQK